MRSKASNRGRDGSASASIFPNSRAACVEIEDLGGGIDPDIRPRLFTRFVSSKPKGMGLGLVISKSIIEAHGGEIRAAPAEPHGTTIRFTVPAQRENGND